MLTIKTLLTPTEGVYRKDPLNKTPQTLSSRLQRNFLTRRKKTKKETLKSWVRKGKSKRVKQVTIKEKSIPL